MVEHNSDNGKLLSSSRKLGAATEHLIDGSEKRICRYVCQAVSQLDFSPRIGQKQHL